MSDIDSRRAVLHWLLEHGCDVLCTRATVTRDRDRCKICGDTECRTLTSATPVFFNRCAVHSAQFSYNAI